MVLGGMCNISSITLRGLSTFWKLTVCGGKQESEYTVVIMYTCIWEHLSIPLTFVMQNFKVMVPILFMA